MTRSTIFLLIVSALAVGSDQLHGQGKAGTGSHMMIVYVDALEHPDARTLILREPRAKPQNYILVTPQTRPQDLLRAVAALQHSRRTLGDQFERSLRSFVAQGPDRVTPSMLERAARDLRLARDGGLYPVPNFGRRPAVLVRLAPVQQR